jgi:type IV pilus assembly protein PilA
MKKANGESEVSQQRRVIMKVLRSSKGFTLIELMIVVAIIGILAAIAIPNFLQYQLKSKQAEAKTNLGAIRTSEISFNGEHGCYLAVPLWPATAAVAGTKAAAIAWVGPPAPAAPRVGVSFCQTPPGGAAPISLGNGFTELGYAATGNVSFRYAVDNVTNGPGVVTPMAPGAGVCGLVGATGADTGVTNNGFIATANSNLDGDGSLSTFAASDAAGVIECTASGTF